MEEATGIATDDSVGSLCDAVLLWLRSIDPQARSGPAQLAVLRDLQRISNAVAATQVRVTASFAAADRRRGASSRSTAAEVAFARRVGLATGQRLVAASRTLVEDLPMTMAALESGELTESRASIVAAGVSMLEASARRVVDGCLAGSLPGLADGELRETVSRTAARLDPALVERRHRAAMRDRRVSFRPVGDGMAWLGVLTSLVDAAAAEATLRVRAQAEEVEARAIGMDADGPSLAARMADGAIARLTGREGHRGPLVEIQLVATDRTLFSRPGAPGREEPARIVGVGAITAATARTLVRPRRLPRRDRRVAEQVLEHVRDLDHEEHRVTVRRLVATGTDGQLVGIERHRRVLPAGVRAALVHDPGSPVASEGGGTPRPPGDDPALDRWKELLTHPPDPADLAVLDSPRRLFTGLLRRFVLLRDHVCRAPWCSAPVRHVDHAVPHAEGGPTEAANAQGLCVGHNLAKEDRGWFVSPGGGTAQHTLVWRSPAGITHASTAVPLLGWDHGPPRSMDGLPERAAPTPAA